MRDLFLNGILIIKKIELMKIIFLGGAQHGEDEKYMDNFCSKTWRPWDLEGDNIEIDLKTT